MNKYITMPRIICLLVTTIGSALYGIGIDAFIIPHNLLAGGLSGVAIMLYYLTGFAPGTINLILNIPILFAAYRWLGGWAVVTAVYGTVAVSFFIDAFSFMSTMGLSQTPLVGSITGGILIGVSSGMIYRTDGTTGGIDPIAQIVRKYWGLQMGSVIFAINFIIILISAFLFTIEAAVITLISIYIAAVVTNKVMVGLQQRKAAFIISEHAYEISEQIIHTIGRGATLLDAEGAYTHERKKVIFAVINLMQVTKLKEVVHTLDPKAFLLITDASEVIGLGFTFKTPPAVLNALISSPTDEEKEMILNQKDRAVMPELRNQNWLHM